MSASYQLSGERREFLSLPSIITRKRDRKSVQEGKSRNVKTLPAAEWSVMLSRTLIKRLGAGIASSSFTPVTF